MAVSIPLPSAGDTDWMDWATDVDTQVTVVPNKAGRAVTQRVITSNYTLAAGDAIDVVLHVTSAAAMTITLPQDTTVTIAQEIAIPWRQYGAGQITFSPGPGVNPIQSRGSVTHSAGQYAEGVITKVAANTWVLSGDLA